jgi:hypothetical protein
VVECGGLENRYRCKPIEGSNPSSSAIPYFQTHSKRLNNRLKTLFYMALWATLLSGSFTKLQGIAIKLWGKSLGLESHFLELTSDNGAFSSLRLTPC